MSAANEEPEHPLAVTFAEAWKAVGGGQPETAFRHLVRLYSQGRHYHDFHHVERIFAVLHQLLPGLRPSPELVLATFFHDAIHIPGRTDNEARSAGLLAEMLPKGDPAAMARIEAFIAASRTHESEDPEIQLFIDLDLAGLAGDQTAFWALCNQVRRERPDLSDAAFYAEHARFMARILARRPIYYSPLLREALEEDAQRNLQSFMAKAGELE